MVVLYFVRLAMCEPNQESRRTHFHHNQLSQLSSPTSLYCSDLEVWIKCIYSCILHLLIEEYLALEKYLLLKPTLNHILKINSDFINLTHILTFYCNIFIFPPRGTSEFQTLTSIFFCLAK